MLKRAFLLLYVTAATVAAADPAASEASIRELLAVMDVRKTVDDMIPQMFALMENSAREANKGGPTTPEAEKAIAQSMAEAKSAIQEVMAWDKLEPLYIRIYQKSLTQAEVDGMIEFYKSPVGQSMIKKMPVIMQNTMMEMQALMAPMMQRMQSSAQEAARRRAGEDKKKNR